MKNDEFMLTLNSPITEEQWDAIADVDFDNTEEIEFHTKHGKTVRFKKENEGQWLYGEERKFIDLENAVEQYKVLGYPHRPYVNMSCSVCRKITICDKTIRYDFCPHCGARMI